MRCVLDIGHQKTGSKARQQFFINHLDRVKGLRALYANTGREGCWHGPLYKKLIKNDSSLLNILHDELEINPNHADLMIFSYEDFYKLNETQIQLLKTHLLNPIAIIFLRRQDQLVNSLHNQLHKAHRVPMQTINDFEEKILDYDINHDHRATLKRWTKVMGRESVVPILFDKSTSSVIEFFRCIDLELDLVDYQDIYPNQAIDSFGLAVLRWVKIIVQDEQELPHIMREAHNRLALHFSDFDKNHEQYAITFEKRQLIMSHYKDSNDWVHREFFPERSSLFTSLEHGELLRLDYSIGREIAEQIVREARKKHRI